VEENNLVSKILSNASIKKYDGALSLHLVLSYMKHLQK